MRPKRAPAGGQAPAAAPATTAVATFAGGCFWCMEPPYDKLDGVISTTSGYMGGKTRNPTYQEVSAGVTGHTEVVQVVYDPSKVSYDKLLEVYLGQRRPDGEGPPVLRRRHAVPLDDLRPRPRRSARPRRRRRPRWREVEAVQGGRSSRRSCSRPTFWPAEDYHQDYYEKNPVRYSYYRNGCGRDARLRQLWGDRAAKVAGRAAPRAQRRGRFR